MREQGPATRRLRRGSETLPQELYDLIYDATFTLPRGTRDLRGHSIRQHLNILQVFSSSRSQYAKTFYGGDFTQARSHRRDVDFAVRHGCNTFNKMQFQCQDFNVLMLPSVLLLAVVDASFTFVFAIAVQEFFHMQSSTFILAHIHSLARGPVLIAFLRLGAERLAVV